MFPQLDTKMFEQFAANPAAFLTKMADFQRANFEAARKITENNVRAFQELASAKDPQSFMANQSAVLSAAIEQNVQVMVDLWRSLGVELPSAPPAGKRK